LQRFSQHEIYLYLVLLLFTTLAWFNIADTIAYKMNVESLKETTSAYVVIKSFDALITWAQELPIIGSVLAPYKDFFDRMSWVMLVALMSLGIQKVIIVTLQSFVVNAIISLTIGLLVLHKFVPFLSYIWEKKILKLAILLLFIRFAIPLLTLTMTSIEISTHQMQGQVSREEISLLQDKILNIQKMLEESDEKKLEKEQRIDLMRDQIEQLRLERHEQEKAIHSLKTASHTGILDSVTAIFETLEPQTKIKIAEHEARIERIDQKLKTLRQTIANESRSQDLSTMIKAKIKTAIANINVMMEQMFDTFVTWVVLFLFKNVLFPLLFLWGLVTLAKGTFRQHVYPLQ
jgi:ABC-type multidrug transport system fused ATPase/permease subunit